MSGKLLMLWLAILSTWNIQGQGLGSTQEPKIYGSFGSNSSATTPTQPAAPAKAPATNQSGNKYGSFGSGTTKPKAMDNSNFGSAVHTEVYTAGFRAAGALVTVSREPRPLKIRIVNCDVCNGSGQMTSKVLCPYCKGAPEQTCSSCRGSGKSQCDNCDGRGIRSCGLCGGTGKDPGVVDLVSNLAGMMAGSTTYQHVESPCVKCSGTGQVECNKCYGKGIRSCPRCSGHGKVSCQHCEGQGYMQSQVTCPKCDGEKLIYR